MDIINGLYSNLDFLKSIEQWHRYTVDKYISQMVSGMFFEIKRGEKLLFWKSDEVGKFIKLDLFKLMDKFEENATGDDRLILDILRAEFEEYFEYLIQKLQDLKPIIDKIFELPFTVEVNEPLEFIYREEVYDKELALPVIKSFEQESALEDYLTENLDYIEAVKVNAQIYYRPQLLSEEYKEFEYNTLIAQEKYELLGWLQKLKRESENLG
jgi:hypothetical protein